MLKLLVETEEKTCLLLLPVAACCSKEEGHAEEGQVMNSQLCWFYRPFYRPLYLPNASDNPYLAAVDRIGQYSRVLRRPDTIYLG